MSAYALVVISLIMGLAGRDKMLLKDSEPIYVQGKQDQHRKKKNLIWASENKKQLRILVLSGGGVRGLMQLKLLEYLEEKTGKPTMELFDGFITTSIGSAIASMLTRLDASGKPLYSARELSDIFMQRHTLDEIFKSSMFRRITTGSGLFGPKYSSKSKEAQLKKMLGDTAFCELARPIVIMSWRPDNMQPVVFSNWTQHGFEHWPVYTHVHAATAAPIFFPSVQINDVKNKESQVFSDAGIYNNTPADEGLISLFQSGYKKHKDVVLVMMGSGYVDRKTPYSEIRSRGAMAWLGPLARGFTTLDALFSEWNIKQVAKNTGVNFDVTVLNANFPEKHRGIDDVSDANLKRIIGVAEQIIAERREDLDRLALKLQKH